MDAVHGNMNDKRSPGMNSQISVFLEAAEQEGALQTRGVVLVFSEQRLICPFYSLCR